MKKGFTLVELLTVILLMGVLGTTAIGGYRAMQRGMEQKGVLQNANSAIRAAYQRAQIDRQPTMIYFWNETIASSTEDENATVVGRAVAIRRQGRFSAVRQDTLVDEFNLWSPFADDDDDRSSGSASGRKDTMYLYPMDKTSDMEAMRRTLVRSTLVESSETPLYVTGRKPYDGGEIKAFGYAIEDAGGVSWKPGMSYGCEFLTIELPRGYIFGTDYSDNAGDPIRNVKTLVFKPGRPAGASAQIEVSYLKNNGDTLSAVSIGQTTSPDRSL